MTIQGFFVFGEEDTKAGDNPGVIVFGSEDQPKTKENPDFIIFPSVEEENYESKNEENPGFIVFADPPELKQAKKSSINLESSGKPFLEPIPEGKGR